MSAATQSGLPGAEAPQETVPAPTPPKPGHWHGVLESVQSMATLIVIALFIITFTFQPFRIPSESMIPTLLVGDFLLVNKEVSKDVSSGAFSKLIAPTYEIHRGDLIVFHYPVDPSMHLVKRVIGLPGDHVRLHDGKAWIDGQPLNEPYAIFRRAEPDSYRDEFPQLGSIDPNVDSRWWIQLRSLVNGGEITVPADSFFVLGDNRNDSEDSRYWGFVPRAAIVGKPFMIYFSVRTPGETRADAQLPQLPAEPHTRLGSVIAFARWDRAMSVIH